MLFAVALLDASIIGAFAVSLSTAYAIGDVLGLKHSLHRGVRGAKGFYAVYAGLIAVAAAIVLIPGSPLGLLTEGVQMLAGVLLPQRHVFLLLLCNDREVLGPWVNGRKTNLFTAAVVAVLVALSVILTASVLFPGITSRQIIAIMAGCGLAAVVAAGYAGIRGCAGRPGRRGLRRDQCRGRWRGRCWRRGAAGGRRVRGRGQPGGAENWRMPPLALLQRPVMSTGRKIGMSALRLYLAVAMILVIVKIVQLAIGH